MSFTRGARYYFGFRMFDFGLTYFGGMKFGK